jgi:hypothetical protein
MTYRYHALIEAQTFDGGLQLAREDGRPRKMNDNELYGRLAN